MTDAPKPSNFLRTIIRDDLAAGRVSGVVTRFPPEPNGYLHIGHAKSICVNFGLAQEFGGVCNLRFDDTNPSTEDVEYVDSIIRDVSWLGYAWDGEVRYASDYFETLYGWAQHLVREGLAYVCELGPEDMRQYRGTLTEPGRNSPWRERPAPESLELLARMRQGAIEEGRMTLRARIDMGSPNLNLRDPVLYRVKHAHHHRTGNAWHIYPSYDFAHGQEDAIEHVTHSICTLEFEDHRPLYEWFIANLPVPSRPRQYEFARLNLSYTITSKRKLRQLVEEGHVQGWDDPRMPTISGLRRRGVSPGSIRDFVERTGVSRSDGLVDLGMFEYCIRDDLDKNAPRAMCVLRPLKVTLTNYPDAQHNELLVMAHPQRLDLGQRVLPFSRELWIDREDFRMEASKDYKRLVLGAEVRLRNAYVIRADEVVRDAAGEIVELRCSYDPDTLGKNPADGRKVKGVIHWVEASRALDCEVRLYDRLFRDAQPDAGERNFLDNLNPDSLQVLAGCKAERSLADAALGQTFQFEREGYFCRDPEPAANGQVVFNRTIGLRDVWSEAGKG
ncbi:MAG: glutamine--tRNA ligase/YqeY domain fusion protein [Gammaproteobacteria bacterium]|nr:glutamine--tRNA ligase/YqeY domain fusion protein [Gammaproteobacteria bacterium]